MTFWILGLVALMAIVALVMYFLRDESLHREQVEAELHDPATPKLEYVVPTGEDPIIVVAALERAGFTVGVDSRGTHQVVLVKCPDGRDVSRAAVRSVIATAGTTTPRREVRTRPDVQFRDELV
jgi:hypothetical protein